MKSRFLLAFVLMFTAVATSNLNAQEQGMKPLTPAEQAFNQGLEQQGLNNLDGAIALYTRALELDNYYPDAFNNRGKARMDKGDYANAIADFSEAIKYQPDSFEAVYNRGIANFYAGNHEAAVADLTRTITQRPTEANAYNVRGSAYRALNKPKDALGDYDKALAIVPLAEAFYNRGVTREDLKEQSLALVDYTRAIELNPNFAQAYAARGTIYLQQKKDADANRDFAQAFELDASLRTELEPYIKKMRAARRPK